MSLIFWQFKISAPKLAPQVNIYGSVTPDMEDKKSVLIALGANLTFGDMLPEETVLRAIRGLREGGLHLIVCSPLYRTPCFPAGAGPDYVNAAARVAAPRGMTAADVLAILHAVEADFGRKRDTRWGMRTLDIDLLAFGDAVLPDLATYRHWRDMSTEMQVIAAPDRLIVPHPRMHERAFVLVPLGVVAPEWLHPVLGQSVASLLAALPAADRAAVQEIVGPSAE